MDPQDMCMTEMTTTNWEHQTGKAYDIGVGANNAVWVIGTNATGGGYGIFKWQGTDWK